MIKYRFLALGLAAVALVCAPQLHADPVTLSSNTVTVGQGPCGCTLFVAGAVQLTWGINGQAPITIFQGGPYALADMPETITMSFGPSDSFWNALVGVMDSPSAQFGTSLGFDDAMLQAGQTLSSPGVTWSGETLPGLDLLYFAYPSQNVAGYTITGLTVSDALTSETGAEVEFKQQMTVSLQGYANSAVPEPGAFYLLLTGLAGLGVWGWRQRTGMEVAGSGAMATLRR